MICSRGQVLIFKEKLEQSIAFLFCASSCKFHRLGSLNLIRSFFFGSESNNKAPNVTTQKACGPLAECQLVYQIGESSYVSRKDRIY